MCILAYGPHHVMYLSHVVRHTVHLPRCKSRTNGLPAVFFVKPSKSTLSVAECFAARHQKNGLDRFLNKRPVLEWAYDGVLYSAELRPLLQLVPAAKYSSMFARDLLRPAIWHPQNEP